MKNFTDANGRKWSVVIDVNAIKRVRDLAKLDLMRVVESREIIEKLTNPSTVDDVITQVDVLYAICKPEADAAAVTDEGFGAGLGGSVREEAMLAVMEGIADFFPSHRQKPLKLAMKRLAEIREKSMGMVIDRLNSPELEAQVMASVKTALETPLPTLGTPSGTTPVSSV